MLRQSALTVEQLKAALALQEHQSPRRRIGQILLEQKLISQEQLLQALADQWELAYCPIIAPTQLAPSLVRRLPIDFLRKFSVIPIRMAAADSHQPATASSAAIAMSDPLDTASYDAVANIIGRSCPRVICPPEQIEHAISSCYYKNIALAENQTNEQQNVTHDGADDANLATQPEDLLNIANQPPTIKLVNMLFFRAIQSRASDIHIEPYEDELKIRFRVDGVLHDILSLPRQQGPALVSRLKIMASLDIAERRLPQDGQSRLRIGQKEMDVRISTIPISSGERIVLRLLDKGDHQITFDQIGLDQNTRNRFRQLINLPYGIILLTGPTGSGKTTTLYAALNELNRQKRNILTVEDPIEYQLPGVGQMQVKPKINLTFANCLRHILRQDPDIIMVGEIRDQETAQISIQASLTGHLVLSTLHTNDSASAITRLTDMGVESYLISSSLTAVMAQRLLRTICPQCKSPYTPTQDISGFWSDRHNQPPADPQFYRGSGCDNCMQTGYLGRTGIFELLLIDDDIKEMITKGASCHLIKEHAVTRGMVSLRTSGLMKAWAGETTIDEVLRVTQDNVITEFEAREYDKAALQ